VVGGPEFFEPYMKAHIEEFAGKSIITDDWKIFLYSFMEKNFGSAKKDALDTIDWNSWLHSPGMVILIKCFFFNYLIINLFSFVILF
jgi:leukotriene-A4 hydrolase